jgi:hypothetical protein
MLETPDLRYWGRSDHIHLAIHAVLEFQKSNNRLPSNSAQDADTVLTLAKQILENNKNTEGITVE